MSTEDVSGSQVTEKGILQVLFDLKFAADILCGRANEELLSESPSVRSPYRRKQKAQQSKSVIGEHTKQLVDRLSQRLDPIDWRT